MRTRTFSVVALLAPIGAAVALAGCGGSSDTGGVSGGTASAKCGNGAQLALVAYSTPKKAYDALTTALQSTSAGEGVSFTQSFGASSSNSGTGDPGQCADTVAVCAAS